MPGSIKVQGGKKVDESIGKKQNFVNKR